MTVNGERIIFDLIDNINLEASPRQFGRRRIFMENRVLKRQPDL